MQKNSEQNQSKNNQQKKENKKLNHKKNKNYKVVTSQPSFSTITVCSV